MEREKRKEEWVERVLKSTENREKQHPSAQVLTNILEEIEVKNERISSAWVRAVAAVFLCVLSIEIAVVSMDTAEESIELTEIIPDNDNTIYYE